MAHHATSIGSGVLHARRHSGGPSIRHGILIRNNVLPQLSGGKFQVTRLAPCSRSQVVKYGMHANNCMLEQKPCHQGSPCTAPPKATRAKRHIHTYHELRSKHDMCCSANVWCFGPRQQPGNRNHDASGAACTPLEAAHVPRAPSLSSHLFTRAHVVHTTCIPRATHVHITCTPRASHMHIPCTPRAHHVQTS